MRPAPLFERGLYSREYGILERKLPKLELKLQPKAFRDSHAACTTEPTVASSKSKDRSQKRQYRLIATSTIK